jgi:hypothetical protein
MDNALVTAPTGAAVARPVRLRISSVIVGLALIFAALVVVQHRADAAPAAPAVAAAVAGSSADASVHNQFDIRGFICAILLSVRNAFSRSPFLAIVSQVLNSILAAFGCLPSGATPAPTGGFPFGGVGFNF